MERIEGFAAARTFVHAYYPDSLAALLFGSAARGEATPSSDVKEIKRWRYFKMLMKRGYFAAVFFIGVVVGIQLVSAQTMSRTVTKNVLTSEKNPKIRIAFDKKLEYAGGKAFILFENSQVEQHYFVLRDKEKNIRRVYTVQFENYLPGIEESYSYKIKDKLMLDGTEYMVDFIAGGTAKPRVGSDQEHRWNYLLAKGYKLPAEVVGRRFVRLLDEAKRSEILIIYQEDVKSFDSNLTELYEPANKAKLDKVYSEISKNSVEGFKILN
jgi:hypothetical protein